MKHRLLFAACFALAAPAMADPGLSFAGTGTWLDFAAGTASWQPADQISWSYTLVPSPTPGRFDVLDFTMTVGTETWTLANFSPVFAGAPNFVTAPYAVQFDYGFEVVFTALSASNTALITGYPALGPHPRNLFVVGEKGEGFSGNASRGLLVRSGTGAVPEPASWALQIAGFGLIGAAARRRRRASA